MSITLIFTILKFLKKNWKEFALFIIVFSLVMIIIYMSLKINSNEKEIDKLEVKVEQLEITNQLYLTDIDKLSNEIIAQKPLANTSIKIIYRTNDIYYTNKEIIRTKLDKRDGFYFNEIMSNGIKK